MKRHTRSLLVLLLLAASAGGAVFAGPAPVEQSLQLYLHARLSEASRDYRGALDQYAKALELDPENVEIRIAYASLLTDLGMAGTAVRLLDGRKDLDWYGERVLALALARQSARQPELLGEAERHLRKVLEVRPEDPNVQINLAQVLLRSGQPAEAASLLQEVRERHPGNAQLVALHAQALERAGKMDEAIGLYRQCAADPATGGRCRQALVDLLQRSGRRVEAAQAMVEGLPEEDEATRIEATTLLLEAGEPEQALAIAQGVLARDPASLGALRAAAQALIRLGRVGEAERMLKRVLEADPGDVGAHLALVWAAMGKGDLEGARRRLQEAWKVAGEDGTSPQGVQVCLTGARFELIARRPAVAREWLSRILDPRAAGRDLPVLLAETYRRTGEFRDGVGAMLRLQPQLQGEAREVAQALEGELRLRAGDLRGMDRIRVLLERGSRPGVLAALQVLQTLERWEDLLDGVATALERFPGDRTIRFVRGTALERLGRREEAVAVFQKLIADDPHDAAAANYLGYMWADAGEHLEEALDLIRRAVQEDPDSSAYLDSLGWVYFKLGKLEEAERWLRRAVEKGGTDGTVLAHLGQVLAAMGKRDEARTYLQRGLDLGCEHPEQVRQLLESLGEPPH